MFRTTRFFWVLKKKIQGGYASISHQKQFCFGDYASCPHFAAEAELNGGGAKTE